MEGFEIDWVKTGRTKFRSMQRKNAKQRSLPRKKLGMVMGHLGNELNTRHYNSTISLFWPMQFIAQIRVPVISRALFSSETRPIAAMVAASFTLAFHNNEEQIKMRLLCLLSLFRSLHTPRPSLLTFCAPGYGHDGCPTEACTVRPFLFCEGRKSFPSTLRNSSYWSPDNSAHFCSTNQFTFSEHGGVVSEPG